MKNVNRSGIVIHDNKWETTAIPAGTDVSFPYALGITTVLSPSGIANEQSVHTKIVLSKGINFETATKRSGMAISLTNVTAYIPAFVNVFLKLIDDTVMPVRSIATGDIQLPAVVITEVAHEGSLSPVMPIIIPIIIAINIGLRKFLNFSLAVCFFPESDISRTGTPHR